MASSSDPPVLIPAAARQQLGGGVQVAPLRSYGLQEAHRKAREAAREAGDDRPLVLVVPSREPGGTLYVVQSSRLADLIAAGTCEGAHVVRLTKRVVRKHLDEFPGGVLPGMPLPKSSVSEVPTDGHDPDVPVTIAAPADCSLAHPGPKGTDDWAF